MALRCPYPYSTKDEIEYISGLARWVCTSERIQRRGLVRKVFWNYVRLILAGRRRWDEGVDGEAIRDHIVRTIEADPELAREWRPWSTGEQREAPDGA